MRIKDKGPYREVRARPQGACSEVDILKAQLRGNIQRISADERTGQITLVLNHDAADADLVVLAGNSRIQALGFDASKVTDEVIATVLSLPRLERLILNSVGITRQGVARLLEERPQLIIELSGLGWHAAGKIRV
jgi:hypothetical protein